MAKITKEDVRNAYLTDQRRRSKLLYDFYKEDFFQQGYTARFIAEKISQDLEIPISEMMIFLIFSRIINKAKKQKAINPVSNPAPPVTDPKGKSNDAPGNVQEEYVFKNADQYPKKDPISEAFAHLREKK